MNHKRKDELSALNVLFCFLVIFIHVSSSPVSTMEPSGAGYFAVLIPWRLSAFVVQGFLFLSGLKLFLKNTAAIRYGAYCLSRFTSVVIPYILWVVIYYLYFCRNGYFPFEARALAGHLLRGDLVSHFYFVIVILQFYLLLPLWTRLIKAVHPALLLVYSLFLTLLFSQYLPDMLRLAVPGAPLFYNDRLFTTYLIYWIAGCLCGAHYERFKQMLLAGRAAICAAFFLSAAADAALTWLSATGGLFFPYHETVHTMYAVSAILFCCFLAVRYFQNRTLRSRLVKTIDRASYGIYLCHCLVIFMINDLLARLGITRIGQSYLIRTAATYLFSVGFCVLYQWIKQKMLYRKKDL